MGEPNGVIQDETKVKKIMLSEAQQEPTVGGKKSIIRTWALAIIRVPVF